MAVAGDREAGARRRHAAHGRVGGEQPPGAGDGEAEGGGGGGQPVGVDRDLERVGAGAAEGAVDPFARRDRLGAVGLPAGARERGLDPGRQHPEADRDHGPGDEDPAAVLGGEAAEPPDRAPGRSSGAPALDAEAVAEDQRAGQSPTATKSELVEGDEAGQQQEPGADEGG